MSLKRDLSELNHAIEGLLTLTEGLPAIANYAMTDISEQIIRTAAAYIRGDDENPEYWEPLWEVERTLYKWTPEWNKKSRESRRNEDHPLYDTGELTDSLEILEKSRMRSGLKVRFVVGSRLDKAALHEYGGPNPLPNHQPIPARPFLAPAIYEVYHNKRYMASLQRTIDKMVYDALKKKKKPTGKTAKKGKR